MNREQTLEAMRVLAASPAARWIGNLLEGGGLLQKCMRCGAEDRLALPAGVGPGVVHASVPLGFDERLYAWKRAFQVAHEVCAEAVG